MTGIMGQSPSGRQSRRAILRAVGAGALALALPGGPARAAQYDPGAPTVFPRHGTRTASPYTEITFRGVTEAALGAVNVIGTSSGGHSGLLMPHSDGNGVSFVPDARFEPGETVAVRAGIRLAPNHDGSLTFDVAQPAEMTRAPDSRVTDDPDEAPHAFRSRPDLRPPVMNVTTPASGSADGYVFLGASVRHGQNGAMIVDNSGEVVWFSPPSSDLDRHYDVRVQAYRGEPVITFAEANGPLGYRLGHYVICDSSYRRIAEIQIGNGYTGGDHHEFLLTTRGTALIGAYHSVRWDLTSVGGPPNARVLDNIVQELDIETGRVLFEWHSLDHVALEESYSTPPRSPDNAYDYLHMNSIEEDEAGDIYISARHTYAIYKIDRASGEVTWRLNGKRSDFVMGEGARFALQHDARAKGNGVVTLFDNAAGRQEADATTDSRGLVLALDEEAMTATLASEYIHPTGILSISQGNIQVLPNGNVFVGWGSAPVFSEFTADGDLIFNCRFPRGGTSYRAYRHRWIGQPADPPALVAVCGAGGSLVVHMSWNGATEVASWRVVAGPSPVELDEATLTPRTGFETVIELGTDAAYVAVEAVAADGRTLGVSEVVEPVA